MRWPWQRDRADEADEVLIAAYDLMTLEERIEQLERRVGIHQPTRQERIDELARTYLVFEGWKTVRVLGDDIPESVVIERAQQIRDTQMVPPPGTHINEKNQIVVD